MPHHLSQGIQLASPHRPVRARRQLLLFLAAYLLYTGARWMFAGHLPTASAHARWIIGVEHSMHLAVEGSVQNAFSSGASAWLLSNVYLIAQLVVLPAALLLLYRRARPVYCVLRDTVIATWIIALPIFALFPVAPPRMVEPGIADTVSRRGALALTGHSTLFFNPYAAVPSLHVGFAFAIGIAAAAALRPRWAKALVLLWGPLVSLAVVATGNHYIFDVLAGLAVTLVGFAVSQSAGRWARRRPSLPRLVVIQSGRRRLTPSPAMLTTATAAGGSTAPPRPSSLPRQTRTHGNRDLGASQDAQLQ